ncbi:hypothetical protein F5X99DRAFT_413430 [Biscogniauxia marginata]|nr:hypothetical protein F5X99DRAFT_413430 [Biscogniauxia marginata]
MGKKQQQPGRSKPSSAKQSSTTKKAPAKPPTRPPAPPPGDAAEAGAKAKAKAEAEAETKHQQALLDAFSSAFGPVLGRPDFASVLQEVKAALFKRDFSGAFNHGGDGEQPQPEPEPEPDERAPSPDFLAVYAARWSPTRALCYSRVLRRGIGGYLGDLIVTTADGQQQQQQQQQQPATADASQRTRTLNVLCVGGGAAELAALGSYVSLSDGASSPLAVSATLLDTGPWSGVVSSLHASLTTPRPPSRYASAAARAANADANAALVAPAARLRWDFARADVLALGDAGLARLLRGRPPLLVTLLFTLNELYAGAGGVGRTTAFLRALGRVVPLGSLLLVVDSPGSYSEAAVGKGEEEDGRGDGARGDGGGGGGGGHGKRRYPMQWLLDHTLLRVAEDEEDKKRKKKKNREKLPSSPDEGEEKEGEEEEQKNGCRWEKLESHDSIWFRLAEGLRYPIALENMRYQMHLYRACAREV